MRTYRSGKEAAITVSTYRCLHMADDNTTIRRQVLT